MTLPRRLAVIFSDHRVSTFPFAADALALVQGERQRWLWRLVCGVGLGMLLGFAACFLWFGSRLEVLSNTVTHWHEVAETEYRTHHQPVKVSKGQAQVIAAGKERIP